MGCGDGTLKRWLDAKGQHVWGWDKYPPEGQYYGPIDMDKELPFTECRTFDYVTSINVIEHAENPYLFMRTVAKLLKKEGTAIIATDNLEHYWSRLHYDFTGKHVGFDWKDAGPENTHLTPITHSQLLFIADRAGLEVKETFYGNPAIKLLPFVPPIKKWPNPTHLTGQNIFLVLKHAKQKETIQ